MSVLLTTLLSALVPVGVEGVKQGLSHVFGGVKPLTVDDQIKLDQNEIAKLQAVAALDNPGGTPSQWVIDLRGSARYIAAFGVIAAGLGSIFVTGIPEAISVVALEAANIAFGFLFGSRVVANIKK